MAHHAESLEVGFRKSLSELGISKESRILVAVSGGLDSLVLLRLLFEIPDLDRPEMDVAHLNHGLRGGESDVDQDYVKAVCGRFGIRFRTKTLSNCEIERVPKQSTEEAARSIRYQWLEESAMACESEGILTAHHQDDQAETIVHNLARGTGLRGVQGMQSKRCLRSGVVLFRPLLSFSRAQLRDYAEDRQVFYREDLSNGDLRFTRNRLRHCFLPQFTKQYGPKFVESLTLLGKSASIATEILDRMSGEMASACIVTQTDQHVLLRSGPLNHVPSFVTAHFFTWLWQQQNWARQKMTAKHWVKLSEASRSDFSGRFQLPGGVDVSRVKDYVRLLKTQPMIPNL